MRNTPSELLELLNEYLVFEKGVLRTKTDEECEEGQHEFSFLDLQMIEFKVPVDYIIEGDCSDDYWKLPPLSAYPMNENQPKGYPSYLHEVIREMMEETEGKAKQVLCYPTCCGSYWAGYREYIADLFPQFNWIFYEARDYVRDAHCPTPGYYRMLQYAQDLEKAGILGPKNT